MLRGPAVVAQDCSSRAKWRPSPVGLWKWMWMQVFNINLGRSGIGAVVRDSQGTSISVFWGEFECPRFSFDCRTSRRFGSDFIMQLPKLVICSGSLMSVQAVMDFEEFRDSAGIVAKEISRCLQHFYTASLVRIRRLCNAVAHAVASVASLSPSPFVWMFGDIPNWAFDLVNADRFHD